MTLDEKVVMITGAAGFIGSHLTERLLALDYHVYAIDLIELDSCNNLKEIKDHENFHYTVGDIRDSDVLNKFFCKNASIIFHLASVVGVRYYMEDPLHLVDVAISTRNLLEMCIESGTRVLFTSTSEVYGKNPNIPWKEDADRVLGCSEIDRWVYSTSKSLIEHMLFGLYHKDGFPFSTVRPFNVYGPRQNPIYVVSQSIYRVMRGESPDVYDGGKQTRCFTYIDDLVEGIILAATLPQAVGHAFNIGNNVETDMRTAIDCCLSYGRDIEVNEIDTSKKYGDVYQDIVRRVPDNSKALELLGWKPKVQIEEGIEKTVKWIENNHWYIE